MSEAMCIMWHAFPLYYIYNMHALSADLSLPSSALNLLSSVCIVYYISSMMYEAWCIMWYAFRLYYVCMHWVRASRYGAATISRLLQIIGLFCKRALQKRLYSAKETYHFKEPTNCSHPIPSLALNVRWAASVSCMMYSVLLCFTYYVLCITFVLCTYYD